MTDTPNTNLLGKPEQIDFLLHAIKRAPRGPMKSKKTLYDALVGLGVAPDDFVERIVRPIVEMEESAPLENELRDTRTDARKWRNNTKDQLSDADRFLLYSFRNVPDTINRILASMILNDDKNLADVVLRGDDSFRDLAHRISQRLDNLVASMGDAWLKYAETKIAWKEHRKGHSDNEDVSRGLLILQLTSYLRSETGGPQCGLVGQLLFVAGILRGKDDEYDKRRRSVQQWLSDYEKRVKK